MLRAVVDGHERDDYCGLMHGWRVVEGQSVIVVVRKLLLVKMRRAHLWGRERRLKV